MGAEAVLFIAVAVIAVICAAAMLLTENAVHSALFLIANFICVAFMYLILEAPFLAMVQIAVYAGAIMVLFTFVIMLLGAEKLPSGEQVRRFPWFAPLGLTLALAFLIATFFALRSGNIDSQSAPLTQGQLRVVNAAPAVVDELTGIDGFDVYLDGELKGTLDKYSATDFVAYAPGDYMLSFNPMGTENAVISGVVTLTAGSTVTAILTGDGEGFNIDAFEDDITSTERRSGRVTIYNAYTQPISIVEIESELFADTRKVNPIVTDIPAGELSEPLMLPEGAENWTVILAGREQEVRDTMNLDYIFGRLPNLRIQRDTAQIIVVSTALLADGTLVPNVYAGGDLAISARAQFGSPEAVGEVLFIEYLLPFQLVAVLLLAAMVGAIVLTHRQQNAPKPSRATRRKVSRPLTSVITAQTGTDVALPTPAPRLAAPKPEAQPEPEQPQPVGD